MRCVLAINCKLNDACEAPAAFPYSTSCLPCVFVKQGTSQTRLFLACYTSHCNILLCNNLLCNNLLIAVQQLGHLLCSVCTLPFIRSVH